MRQRLLAAGAALLMTALLMSQHAPAAARPLVPVEQPRTLRIAYSDDGVAMSDDGRYVVFTRWLRLPHQNNAAPTGQVYRRDVRTGTTRLVSGDATGQVANAGVFYRPLAVSGDGRYIAFASRSTNLTPESADGKYHILVRDMNSKAILAVPHSGTAPAGSPGFRGLTLSADGRYLACEQLSQRANSRIWATDVYRWQLGRPDSELISHDFGSAAPDFSNRSFDVSMSSDGRYVAFSSSARALLPSHASPGIHAYLRDTESRVTRLIDRLPGGAVSASARIVALSGDGRYALLLGGTDLVGGRSTKQGLYRRELATGRNESIVLTQPLAPEDALWGQLSADGRYVAFVGTAQFEDFSGENQVYVRDMQQRTVRRVSVAPGGGWIQRYSRYYSLQDLVMSADGRFVAYVSSADNQESPTPGTPNGDPYYPDFDLADLVYTAYRIGPLH